MNDIETVKDLITKQNEAWGEFQRTNDAIIQGKADGKSVDELNSKLTTINADMTSIRQSLAEIEKKAGREQAGRAVSDDVMGYRKEYKSYIRNGDTSGLSAAQAKAAQTGLDSNMGYLVDDETSAMIDRIAPVICGIERLANVVTISGPVYNMLVKTSGMSMTRRADGASISETTAPNYSNIRIEAFSADVEPWVYNETLQDARINVEADLAMEAAIGFAEGFGAEYVTGNGVGKCRGITGYTNVANSAYTWGSVGYIASGASGAFAASAPADKIIDLQHALKAQYRNGAVFLTNDSTLALLRQIKDASGSYYLWQPDPSATFGGRLLGHQVEIDDNFAAVAAGSYSLAFGNFKRAYTIVKRDGVTVIRDNVTAKGTTKFNFSTRRGAGVSNFEALKLMRFATS